MKIRIEKSNVGGTVTAPPSKSISHRALICAALCGGKSKIKCLSLCDDVKITAKCLNALGIETEFDGEFTTVYGTGGVFVNGAVLDCGDSGSTFRFLLAAAAVFGVSAVFKCSERLFERLNGDYGDFLRDNGCDFAEEKNAVILRENKRNGNVAVRADKSSQYVSGALMAIAAAGGELNIVSGVASRPYIDMTLDVLKRFGVDFITDGSHYEANGKPVSTDYTVSGDWSAGAFLYAFNLCGGRCRVNGLEHGVGGDEVCLERFADILSKENVTVDVSGTPDIVPLLIVAGVFGKGCTLTGTNRLKYKESDRTLSMKNELSKFGADITVEENAVTVTRAEITAPSRELLSCGDHRIVMALTVLCSVTGGVIDGVECVGKSLPEYFKILDSLNVKYRVLE